jgi:hypothetical protein
VSTVEPRNTVAAFISNIVTDPVQPIFYTNTGGTGITIYNAYNATVTRSFRSMVGRAGTMAISSDDAISRHMSRLDRPVTLT